MLDGPDEDLGAHDDQRQRDDDLADDDPHPRLRAVDLPAVALAGEDVDVQRVRPGHAGQPRRVQPVELLGSPGSGASVKCRRT